MRSQFVYRLAAALAVLMSIGSVSQAAIPDPGSGVPEINAGLLGSGIALLAGGVALLRDRFRAR